MAHLRIMHRACLLVNNAVFATASGLCQTPTMHIKLFLFRCVCSNRNRLSETTPVKTNVHMAQVTSTQFLLFWVVG